MAAVKNGRRPAKFRRAPHNKQLLHMVQDLACPLHTPGDEVTMNCILGERYLFSRPPLASSLSLTDRPRTLHPHQGLHAAAGPPPSLPLRQNPTQSLKHLTYQQLRTTEI